MSDHGRGEAEPRGLAEWFAREWDTVPMHMRKSERDRAWCWLFASDAARRFAASEMKEPRPDTGDFWAAVNAYAIAVGGDPFRCEVSQATASAWARVWELIRASSADQELRRLAQAVVDAIEADRAPCEIDATARDLRAYLASQPSGKPTEHASPAEAFVALREAADGALDDIAPSAEKAGETHPEDACGKCGGPNVVWFAPSKIWNATYRKPGAVEIGIVCPVCFVKDANASGFDGAWRVAPEDWTGGDHDPSTSRFPVSEDGHAAANGHSPGGESGDQSCGPERSESDRGVLTGSCFQCAAVHSFPCPCPCPCHGGVATPSDFEEVAREMERRRDSMTRERFGSLSFYAGRVEAHNIDIEIVRSHSKGGGGGVAHGVVDERGYVQGNTMLYAGRHLTGSRVELRVVGESK